MVALYCCKGGNAMSIIQRVLDLILKNLTPDIKKAVVAMVLDLEKAAAATKNPYDDMLIKLLKAILGI